MRPLVKLEEYERSVYRLFGRFPVVLMVVSCLVAYGLGILLSMNGGGMEDPIGMEGLSNGFFRGVVFSVAVYYLGRIRSISIVKGAAGLTDRDPDGVFVPCLSHKTPFDLSAGAVIIKEDRLYFEPTRPFGGDRSFDYDKFDGFRFALSKVRESIGLYIITGEKYMLAVEDGTGKRVGTFIIPEPEVYLPMIQELI